MDNKTTERIKAKKIRKSLDMENISRLIISNIRCLDTYKTSQNVMIYYPIANEINLLPLLNDNKQFYLPRVCGETLECCQYNKNDLLKESELNILEPTCKSCSTNILDLIFVPALAVNKNGYRLGYGKGYYDRFLKDCHIKTIIAIPEELIFENIYENDYDVPCDIIITQKKASIERG